jgi:DNA-binding MarR family transcriptional regulator
MKIDQFLKRSVIIPTIFAATKLETKIQKKIGEYDLSILEALILVAIVFEGRECRPSELALNLQASRVRVSQSIKTLAKRNLVERNFESSDARFIAIRVTAKGKSLSTKLIVAFDKINNEVESVLGIKNAEQTAAQMYNLIKKSDW